MAINGFGKGHGILNLDLNRRPDGSDCELGFEFGGDFLEKQTETERNLSVSGEFRRMERRTDGEERGSASKRRRYSAREKGKAKVDSNQPIIVIEDSEENVNPEEGGQIPVDQVGEKSENGNLLSIEDTMSVLLSLNPVPVVEHDFFGVEAQVEVGSRSPDPEIERLREITEINRQNHLLELRREQRREQRRREQRENRERYHEIARYHAKSLAHSDEFFSKKTDEQEKTFLVKEVERECPDVNTPFSMAMEMIKKRNSSSSSGRKKSTNGVSVHDFKWVPSKIEGCGVVKRSAPSLLDLSLNVLATNAEAMVSLAHVPDFLRHKLSQMICDAGKMDASFVKLLAIGSPTEIRVKNCTKLKEDHFMEIFGSCNTRNLTVLQLDLCGQALPDNVLCGTLARSAHSLPALATISLKGAHRLTDSGLAALAGSAPSLQSVNLSQCPLLTSKGMIGLVRCFESTLRELYIDYCQNIDVMAMLPALKKLKCLEVLSVAGIETVSDDFIIEIVKACGVNLKELVFAECVDLTDMAFQFVGQNCSKLCALDLSYLDNLTDSTMQYLADGCRSIRSLKLCRNSFSDEAIAAFLEVSGDSLSELSLNNVREVGLNTALSLAKCSRNLLSLDLSWCRRLTDEALGFIVDSCSSLRLLKVFGCSQITDLFLNGHSNSMVKIIGLKMTPMLGQFNVLEPHEPPLRYSALTSID